MTALIIVEDAPSFQEDVAECYFEEMGEFNWQQAQAIGAESYICGFCNKTVSSDRGIAATPRSHAPQPRKPSPGAIGKSLICPNCGNASMWNRGEVTPKPLPGEDVRNLPPVVEPVYQEARRCMQAQAFNGVVLVCRKILMHVGHASGATGKKTFNEHVEWLDSEGYIPKGGKPWVAHIKDKGNEATHEIQPVTEAQAQEVLDFTLMLLKNVYDYPGRMLGKP